MREVKQQAAQIAYRLWQGDPTGTRPAVVLVHGAGGHALHWPPPVRHLPGYRVYALDLPGHGASSGPGEPTIEGYGARLLAWADAVGLPQAVWVGHSMGGAIVQYLALAHPHRVLGLGLIGTGARLRVHPLILEGLSRPETFSATVERVIRWSFSPASDQRLRQLAAQRMAATPPEVLHDDFAACHRFDVLDRVAEIRCPTLVLCGADDQMTPPRYAQYLAQQIPNAQWVLVPQAGHMVMLEQPQAVAQALRHFLAAWPWGGAVRRA